MHLLAWALSVIIGTRQCKPLGQSSDSLGGTTHLYSNFPLPSWRWFNSTSSYSQNETFNHIFLMWFNNMIWMLYTCKIQNLSCMNLLTRNKSCIAYQYPANCILIEAFNWDRALIFLLSIQIVLNYAFDKIFGWRKFLKINLLRFHWLWVYILIIPLFMNASFLIFLTFFP